MTWDTTSPADSDFISLGDDVIRAFKTDIQTALQSQGSFPGADTANPKYKWTPEYGNTASRPSTNLVTGQLYVNTEVKAIQRYNGATWDNLRLTPNATVDENDIASSVAGNGLTGGAGTAFAVNAGSGLEISSDAVRIAASAAGNGLSGGAGSALAVNVDSSTIEINSDTLRVKDGGITVAKLATGIVSQFKTNVSSSLLAINASGYVSVLSISAAPGALKGIFIEHSRGGGYSGTSAWQMRITMDGGTGYVIPGMTGSAGQTYSIVPFTPTTATTPSNIFALNGTPSTGTLSGMYFGFNTSLQIELQCTSYTDGNNAMTVLTSYEG